MLDRAKPFAASKVGRWAADGRRWLDSGRGTEAMSQHAGSPDRSAPNKLRQLLLRPALIRMLDSERAVPAARPVRGQQESSWCHSTRGLDRPGHRSSLSAPVIADLWQATQERAGSGAASKRTTMV